MATIVKVVADSAAEESVAKAKKAPRVRPVVWPALRRIGLRADEVELRRQFIGGSDANIILCGEPERVLRLWREKRGEEAAEDLTKVLPVMLGSWTEAFNRQWFERQTGQQVG